MGLISRVSSRTYRLMDPNSLANVFNNLITDDKDKLINSMISMYASKNCNKATAKFYLEMCNWNLEQACSMFYDSDCQPILSDRIYSCELVQDTTVGEGESVEPGSDFVKTWVLKNNGRNSWPENDLYFIFVAGDRLKCKRYLRVESIDAGECVSLSMKMTAPRQPGRYVSQWRMISDGYPFGETIWVCLEVSENGMLNILQQFESSLSSWTNNNKVENNSMTNTVSYFTREI